MSFRVDLLDTWDMTIDPIDGIFKIIEDGTYRYHCEGTRKIKLPGKPYIALRITRVEGDAVQFRETARVYGE